MYDYDPYYYIADGCHNHHDKPMAPRPPFFGQIHEPYGPKPPICDCCHNHGKPEKLPPIKRPEHPDDYYVNPPYIPSAVECNCKIPDRYPVSNIINVESQLLITLKITLYGVKEEDDKTVILENGKKYNITYLTESGVKNITGILRYIDTTIPTDCIRYIGEYNEVADFAYIIVDGSTEGNSNIVKIFIRSLRSIDEIKDTTDDSTSNSTSESNSDSQSISASESESISASESESTNISESNSDSQSVSESESESTSVSQSESTNISESNSDSQSVSASESESISTSESTEKKEEIYSQIAD